MYSGSEQSRNSYMYNEHCHTPALFSKHIYTPHRNNHRWQDKVHNNRTVKSGYSSVAQTQSAGINEILPGILHRVGFRGLSSGCRHVAVHLRIAILGDHPVVIDREIIRELPGYQFHRLVVISRRFVVFSYGSAESGPFGVCWHVSMRAGSVAKRLQVVHDGGMHLVTPG